MSNHHLQSTPAKGIGWRLMSDLSLQSSCPQAWTIRQDVSNPRLIYGLRAIPSIRNVAAALVLGLMSSITASPAGAQITPDDTLSTESSSISSGESVRGLPAELIQGGATRGSNLFHSFSEFNVNEGQRVYFANPDGIANILSRVTGFTESTIDGLLGVDGGANLFLLNPNGIVFGPNAELDVGGSFTASTAGSVAFPDGREFSATNLGDGSLLSVNVPLGVQFGPDAPGTITNGGNLSVGQNLSLSGSSITSTGQLSAPAGELRVEGVSGDVQVRQAVAQTATFSASNNLILQESDLQTAGDLNLLASNTVQVRDSETRPFLAYAGENLTVQGNQNIDIFALNYPSSGLVSGGDMVLRSASTVGGDAHYWAGGDFRIEQLDGNLGNLLSPYDPIIRSFGNVSFDSYIGTSLHVLAAGDVNVPNFIQITGEVETGEAALRDEELTLSDGNSFPIDGFREPTLDIRAGVDPAIIGVEQLSGMDNFNTLTLTPPPIDSADINIGTIILGFVAGNQVDPVFLQGRILLTNQYEPDQNNLVPGNISIFDTQINLENNPELNGVAIRAETPNGGGIIAIDSRGDINIRGRINANAVPSPTYTANGGDVTLLSRGTITFSSSTNTAIGGVNSIGIAGGDIALRALENINLLQNVQILARNIAGAGNAGKIDISAGDTVTISAGSDPSVATDVAGGTGNGNDLTITARLIEINNNSIVAASILAGGAGTARAGNINIRATEQVSISGNSVVFSEIGSTGVGTGGIVNISAPTILLDKSSVNTQIRRDGRGQAGNIQISAPLSLKVTSGGQISSITFGQGDAGNITISSQNMSFDGEGDNRWSRNAFIRRSNPESELMNNVDRSGVFASVEVGATGNAGDVAINAPQLTLNNDAGISTSTDGRGMGGSIMLRPYGNGQSLIVTFEDDESSISASTFQNATSESTGGSITIEAPGSVTIRGFGQVRTPRFSQVRAISNGDAKAGTININASNLTVEDASLSVSASADGAAGNLEITANSIELGNSQLFAEANSGSDGNINIFMDTLLLLRNGSLISANASGQANGGNININPLDERNGFDLVNAQRGFVIANPYEDSNILAFAEERDGGRITINAFAIFGLEDREFTTGERNPNGPTNLSDINASGGFNGQEGVIILNTLNIDPTRGLGELPVDIVDASNLVAEGCIGSNRDGVDDQGEFTRSGRGGFSPGPSDVLNDDTLIDPSAPPAEADQSAIPAPESSITTNQPLIEAQGLAHNGRGQVSLVSGSANLSTSSPLSSSNPCDAP